MIMNKTVVRNKIAVHIDLRLSNVADIFICLFMLRMNCCQGTISSMFILKKTFRQIVNALEKIKIEFQKAITVIDKKSIFDYREMDECRDLWSSMKMRSGEL